MAFRGGANILRRGALTVATPAGGAVNSAVTVTGTVVPNGAVVETAWHTDQLNPPSSGWGAATTSTADPGSWSRSTTRPAAAATYFLHVRLQNRPRVNVASAAVVVT